jgi:hypothetical protein
MSLFPAPAPGRPPAPPRLRHAIDAALVIALLAMAALHAVQPELGPIEEPVSFYIAGRHGWLLIVALFAFGLASVLLAWIPAFGTRGRKAVVAFAVGMWITAFVPSDPWFPWERPPTWHGLAHGAAALLAPPVLLIAMRDMRSAAEPRGRWLAYVYLAALLASAISLGAGFLFDRAPPLIGLAERVLAMAAVAWTFRAAHTQAYVSSSSAA